MGALIYYLWDYKLVQPPWKTVWRFLKNLKRASICWLCQQDRLLRDQRKHLEAEWETNRGGTLTNKGEFHWQAGSLSQ